MFRTAKLLANRSGRYGFSTRFCSETLLRIAEVLGDE